MQIKQTALSQHLQKQTLPLYLLVGQENYLLEKAFEQIKRAIKSLYEVDEKIITIEATDDWRAMVYEANSYSMFAEMVLINVVYEKKTLNATEKQILSDYLKSVNPRTRILIRAPHLPLKQVQAFVTEEEALVVVANSLDAAGRKQWIVSELKNKAIDFEASVPELIHQYTENNLEAAAQLIEKIELTLEPKTRLEAQQILAEVSNQCDFSPFELIEVCLSAQSQKALQILRHAANNKTEPPFILWMLAQEIRLLLQLSTAQQKKVDFKTACCQLKIWPQRIRLYEACLKRHNHALLTKLLQYCQVIDERIKSHLNSQVWNALEKLALGLCLGKLMEAL